MKKATSMGIEIWDEKKWLDTVNLCKNELLEAEKS
jgi:hypothetical protein